jgi:hypothetical protein
MHAHNSYASKLTKDDIARMIEKQTPEATVVLKIMKFVKMGIQQLKLLTGLRIQLEPRV